MEVPQQPTQALATRGYMLPWGALVFSSTVILSLLGNLVRSPRNPFPHSELVYDVLANPSVQRFADWDFPLAASSAISGRIAQTAAGHFPIISTWTSSFATSTIFQFVLTIACAELTLTIGRNIIVLVAVHTFAGWAVNTYTLCCSIWGRKAPSQHPPPYEVRVEGLRELTHEIRLARHHHSPPTPAFVNSSMVGPRALFTILSAFWQLMVHAFRFLRTCVYFVVCVPFLVVWGMLKAFLSDSGALWHLLSRRFRAAPPTPICSHCPHCFSPTVPHVPPTQDVVVALSAPVVALSAPVVALSAPIVAPSAPVVAPSAPVVAPSAPVVALSAPVRGTPLSLIISPELFTSRSLLVAALAPQIRLIRPFNGSLVYEALVREANSVLWIDYTAFLTTQAQVSQFDSPRLFLNWFLTWLLDADAIQEATTAAVTQARTLGRVAVGYREVLEVLRTLDQLPYLSFSFTEIFTFLTTEGALSLPWVAPTLKAILPEPDYFTLLTVLDEKYWELMPSLPGKPYTDPHRTHYIRNGRPFMGGPRVAFRGPRSSLHQTDQRTDSRLVEVSSAGAAINSSNVSIHNRRYYHTPVILPSSDQSTLAFWDLGSTFSYISSDLVRTNSFPTRDTGQSITNIVHSPPRVRTFPAVVASVRFQIVGLPTWYTFDCIIDDWAAADLVLGDDFWAAYYVSADPAHRQLMIADSPLPVTALVCSPDSLTPSSLTSSSLASPSLTSSSLTSPSLTSPPLPSSPLSPSPSPQLFSALSLVAPTPAPPSAFPPPPAFTAMLQSFKAVRFDGVLPPVRPSDYLISIRPGAIRAHNRPLPTYTLAELNHLKAEVDRLSTLGLIERSDQRHFLVPSLVEKKNGDFRIVFDYRSVNAITLALPTSLSSFRSLMPGLSDAKIFSSLDLKSGYNQLRIHDDTKPFTAFNTPFGVFQWRVLPFGLCDAPQVFGSYMTHLLQPYSDFCRVYLDDIIIFSPDPATHHLHVQTILSALTTAQHQLNWDKCTFHSHSITWVGHQISADGIAPTDTFKGQVAALRPPTSKSGIQVFLGHIGYLHDMIPHYGHRAQPLTDLLVKHKHFRWSEEAQASFDDLKNAILHAFPLRSFDPTLPIHIHTDASKFAASAVLLQPLKSDGSKLYPIEYRSHKFDRHQRNWDIHAKEFWAIMFACEKFRFYVHGRFFTIHSDQKSISQIFQQFSKTPDLLSPNIQRWMLKILHYNFDLSYIPGAENVLADHLSRNPAHDTPPLPTITTAGAAVSIPSTTIHATPTPASPSTISTHLHLTPPSAWFTDFRQAYAADPVFGPIYHQLTSSSIDSPSSDYAIKPPQQLLYRHHRLCIPQAHVSAFLHHTHSSIMAGHPGIRRWLQDIRGKFYFPNMQQTVEHYVRGCDRCLRVKPSSSLPAGLLQPVSPPQGRWSDIATDLITGLPEAKFLGQTVDAILTIVCKFSNRTHFYPVLSRFTTQDFVDLFIAR